MTKSTGISRTPHGATSGRHPASSPNAAKRVGLSNMEVLDQSECWRLLRTQDVGRLSVVVEGEPDIFPVNYVVDHGSIVIRTAAGRKLAASVRGAVAFEVDELHGSDASVWSVVLRGRATEIRDKDEVMAVLALGLVTWHVGRKPRFLRLVPWATTGRRLQVQGRKA